MIEPPFANYHRAELERLVQEGFELIERLAVERQHKTWSEFEAYGFVSAEEFQVLVAADYYLRSTEQYKNE